VQLRRRTPRSTCLLVASFSRGRCRISAESWCLQRTRGGVSANYTFFVKRERWSQLGISLQFLIIVMTLGEFFRLKYVHGTRFSTAEAAPYIGGVLIAACLCWAAVILYFCGRYRASSWITIVSVLGLLVYKLVEIGW
jgi:hypothetical protein